MKILHLDIETAPSTVYAWGLFKQTIGINQIITPGYTLCWAAKWHGDDDVMFSSINDTTNEDMLAYVWELLDEADVVVHYNGARFDIPTLNREFVMMNWEPPSTYHQVDLLRTVRQRFRFLSNKLDFVCQQLGLGSKTVHKGMPLWTACMEFDPEAWAEMREYNINDIHMLESLYTYVLPWIKSHPNHALYTETTAPVCPNCGSTAIKKNGVEHTKALTYQRYKCTECGTNIKGRGALTEKEKKAHILSGSTL